MKTEVYTCPEKFCNGGSIQVPFDDGHGGLDYEDSGEPCSTCAGTGYVAEGDV